MCDVMKKLLPFAIWASVMPPPVSVIVTLKWPGWALLLLPLVLQSPALLPIVVFSLVLPPFVLLYSGGTGPGCTASSTRMGSASSTSWGRERQYKRVWGNTRGCGAVQEGVGQYKR